MSDRPDIPPEKGVLAAEYVLGLMSAEARVAFQARLASEPELVAEVRAWETYFATMAEVEVADVTPPPALQHSIEAAIFGSSDPQAPTLPHSIWERISFWRGATFASLAVAIVAIGVAILPDAVQDEPGEVPSGIPAGTILMTHLIPTEGSTLGLAVTREPSGQLQVRRVAGEMTVDRAQELWLIIGENPPVSLGLLERHPLTTITPDADLSALFEVGAALAVSDEPPGGSPTGAPTGSVLALGTLVAL